MESDLLNTVLELYHDGKWQEILNLNQNSDNRNALKLLWVWPNSDNFNFIKAIAKELNVRGIMSIGCGCGLLEWILNQSTGLLVEGLEINKEWWESKYSNPKFIDLQYVDVDVPLSSALLTKTGFALLFCYFNNGPAFRKYIDSYSGNVVIIIGPGDGTGRYTDPQPFNPVFGNSQWTLYKSQEVKSTKDFIVVYTRSLPA